MQSIILILLSTLLCTITVVTIVYHRWYKQLSNHLENIEWKYMLLEKQSRNILSNTDDIQHDFDTTYSSITKLNNNVASYLNQEEQRRSTTFIMPKPDQSKVIDETIREQIITEATLAKSMRVIDKNLINIIAENVEKTYPNVDKSYLTKKILMRIEEFNETAQKVAEMASCELYHPENACVGFFNTIDKAGVIRKRYADAARTEIANFAIMDPVMNAHDVYLFMVENVIGEAKRSGESQATLLKMQDVLARVLNINWKEYDVGGTVAWKPRASAAI